MRSIIAVVSLTFCVWAMWSAGRAGYSRLLSANGMESTQPAVVERAVQLSPLDPEAHFARATTLEFLEQDTQAIKEYQQATFLRPRDYYLWLRLGFTQYYADDIEGAVESLRKSVQLAPFYAQPRWLLGKSLLRLGRRDEAFAELRRAVASDPKLLNEMIALAWETYGDVGAVVQAVQPQAPAVYLALARSLLKYGKIPEAMVIFRAAADIMSDKELHELLNDLLSAKKFSEAFEVWSSGRGKGNNSSAHSGVATITDSGFESGMRLGTIGFDWQVMPNVQNVRVSLDGNDPHAGARSLRLDFDGNSDPTAAVVRQLVLVEPQARYRLRFAARPQEVVTGGLPIISVTDAGREGGAPLGRSAPLQQGRSGWQDYTVEFTTTAATAAIYINIARENCTTFPCPIFGHLWLDDFSLQNAGITRR